MKNWKFFLTSVLCASLVFGFASCSNGSDDSSALLAVAGGGTNTTAPTAPTNPTTPTTPTDPTNPTIPTTPATYTITFNANDGSEVPATATQDFVDGTPQALTLVEDLGFSKAGFNFAGWGTAADATESAYADGASYTASDAATLYAMWSAIPVYSVNIPVNEYGSVTASPATATAGTEITLSNTPNAGYQFISYSVIDADGTTVTVTYGKFTMPAQDVIVTAVFTAMTYTITFNANDGSSIPATATQEFTAGIPQALKTIAELGFSKDGSSFAGWGISADATESSYADGAEYIATSNMTLYALWSAVPVYSVYISPNANGSVTASSVTATAGTEITLSNTPNAGYKFSSYTVTDADGTVVTVTDGKFTMPAKNVTVAARYMPVAYRIYVEKAVNGSVTASEFSAKYGTIVTLTISPASGYELATLIVTDSDGTSVAVSGTGNTRTFSMPAKTATVTTTFKAVIYTITFNINDGSQTPVTETQIFTGDTPQKLKTIAELGFKKDGFNFDGWGISADTAQAVYKDGANYTATANVTLYALWSAIPVYSVNIPENENGSVTATSTTATAGTEITLSNTPNTGYRFGSYTVIDADGKYVTVKDGKFTMPAKNVTVTATFSAIYYRINIGTAANGRVSASPNSAKYGESVSLTITPEAGYGLATLTVIDSDGTPVVVRGAGFFTMPAKNVTVTATFSIINYKIYLSSGFHGSVTASSTTATVGTEITLSNTPNEGYRFSGYNVTKRNYDFIGNAGVSVSDGKFTMPASDVDVYAAFEAINYSISIETTSNGSVIINSNAAMGDEVWYTATPVSGYQLQTLTVVDEDGAVVTVTDSYGEVMTSATLDHGKFTMPAKNVTVTATFDVIGAYKQIGEKTPFVESGIQYDLVTFGLWPQTIKNANVTVDESETKSVGVFTYCKGSDGEWYVKQEENVYENEYNTTAIKYSDGTTVAQSSVGSYKWFKVEPIRWHILTTNYGGAKLLLSENILIAKRYDDDKNNYKTSEIRAWLNGDFINSAFTSAQQSMIKTSAVGNSARSTNPDANDTQWNNGANQYASDTSTTDKVFLLSEQEVTKTDYGFSAYNKYGVSVYSSMRDISTRTRVTTDFAKATGANQSQKTGMGGWWWLRSPYYGKADSVRVVDDEGRADNSAYAQNNYFGVVPALCVKN